MLAVDPPNRPADRKEGKHKEQSASNATKHSGLKECNIADYTIARRACYFKLSGLSAES
jgi:hypothetical protein